MKTGPAYVKSSAGQLERDRTEDGGGGSASRGGKGKLILEQDRGYRDLGNLTG